MIRKFNYTNRKKLDKEDITISVRNDGGKTSFSVIINVDNLKFPEYAKIYVEPYYGPNYLRFSYGSCGIVNTPSDTDISELKKISDKVYFRIKIVDETQENGLLLAYGDKLPVVEDGELENRTSLLYVNAITMNTCEIWRLSFNADNEGMPVLEVNNAIEGVREMAKTDSKFIALVYPNAIRQILHHIAFEIKDFDLEGESWTCKWIKFTIENLGISNTPKNSEDEEEISYWMDDVVRSFCLRHKTLDNFTKSIL